MCMMYLQVYLKFKKFIKKIKKNKKFIRQFFYIEG